MATDTRPNRKSITFNPILLEVLDEEVKRRGGLTSYSAVITEVLMEKFAKEVRVKELEHEANLSKFQKVR